MFFEPTGKLLTNVYVFLVARLGQIPEAFASQTKVGQCEEMLLMGHTLTASMAQTCGLVTSVLWPGKFLEDIVPRIETLEVMNPTGLKAIKLSLKRTLKTRVLSSMDEETKDLISCWASQDFAKNVRYHLKTAHLIFQ